MHRRLSRAARQSLANLLKPDERAQAYTVERTQQPSPSFLARPVADYSHFRWRDKLRHTFSSVQIVNALRHGEREKALHNLLNLGDTKGPLNVEDFIYILEYCARAPDPTFTMEACKIMKDKGICLNKRCTRLIVQAFTKGGYLEEAFNWLTFLQKNDHGIPVLPVCNIYLNACGRTESFAYADRCLELMEHQLIGKSEITYWELLRLAVLQRNLSAAEEIWKEYMTYYNPSIITLRKFIWAFVRLSDLESAYRALQYMVALASEGSASVEISAAGRYQVPRLDIPIPLGNDLLDKRYGLRDGELHYLSKQNSVRMKKDFGENCVDPFNDQDSLINVDKSFDLESASNGSSTKDIFFTESSGDGGKSNSNSLLSSHGAITDGFSNQYFAVEQEVHAESSINMKHQNLVFGTKGNASVQVMNILRWSFSEMIHACAEIKNFKQAEQLFEEMQSLGLKPSPHTYDGLVKAVINGKGVVYGMKVIEEMENRGMKPYSNTLIALSVCLSKNLELELAEALLERISDSLQKFIYSFNAFFAACDVRDEPERALRILAKMKRMNIKSNIRTFEILFSLFGNVNVPYERGNMLSRVDVAKRVKAIEMDMMTNAVQHSYSSLKKLIRALGAEGMIQEMLQYLKVAENMLWDSNSYQKTAMYNVVLHSLVKAKETQKAIDVFKNMRICGFPANIATYNIMIECCSILSCLKSAYALVSIMLRDGFCPQPLTYTALIKVLLANEHFEVALSLLDQLRFEDIQPDIQLFNTILREAYRKGRIDIIELIVEHVHREKIQPDPSTCWYTFSAYVECGFHSTAMEALLVLSMRMISEEGSTLQEKRVSFENLVYSEDPDAELQIIEIFKESQEFLATALLNLRMCAINGSSITWLPDESSWAKRLSSSYSAKTKAA